MDPTIIPTWLSLLTGPFAATVLLAMLVAAALWWLDRRAWPAASSWVERHLGALESQGKALSEQGARLADLVRVHEESVRDLSAAIGRVETRVESLHAEIREVRVRVAVADRDLSTEERERP